MKLHGCAAQRAHYSTYCNRKKKTQPTITNKFARIGRMTHTSQVTHTHTIRQEKNTRRLNVHLNRAKRENSTRIGTHHTRIFSYQKSEYMRGSRKLYDLSLSRLYSVQRQSSDGVRAHTVRMLRMRLATAYQQHQCAHNKTTFFSIFCFP